MNRVGLVFLISLWLCGCGSVTYLNTAVDPGYAPTKADPVYLTLSAEPSIRDRQLLVSLRDELCRNKFTVVSNIDQSKWTLALTSARQTFETGVTSTAVKVPGLAMVVGSSHRDLQTNQFAQLRLFKSSDFSKKTFLSIWDGQVAAENSTFNDYELIIFRDLLNAFGRNLSDDPRINKSYANLVKQCGIDRTWTSPPCNCSTH